MTVQTHVILGNAVNAKDNFRDLGPISSPCTERPTTHIGTTSRIILEISSAPWQILEKSYPRKIPWKEFKPSGEIQNIFKISSLFPSIPETSSQNPGNREDLFFLNLWTHDRTIAAQKNMLLLKSQKASTKTLFFSWCPHQMPSKSPKHIYCILQKHNLFLKPPWNHHVIFETNLLLNQGHHHHHHHRCRRRHHHRHRHRHRHHSFIVENCSFLLNWWNTII